MTRGKWQATTIIVLLGLLVVVDEDQIRRDNAIMKQQADRIAKLEDDAAACTWENQTDESVIGEQRAQRAFILDEMLGIRSRVGELLGDLGECEARFDRASKVGAKALKLSAAVAEDLKQCDQVVGLAGRVCMATLLSCSDRLNNAIHEGNVQ